MKLYLFLTKSEKENYERGAFDKIKCSPDAEMKSRGYDQNSIYMYNDLRELIREHERFSTEGEPLYLCSFAVPAKVLKENKDKVVVWERGYEGYTVTEFGISHNDLKPEFLTKSWPIKYHTSEITRFTTIEKVKA